MSNLNDESRIFRKKNYSVQRAGESNQRASVDFVSLNAKGSHLCDEEDSVGQKPNTAGVNHHFADGHFGGADSELPAKA